MTVCPELVGPVLETSGGSSYVTFYCVFETPAQQFDAFVTRFLFNNEVHPDAPQGQNAAFVASNITVELRLAERHLGGYMNQWVCISVYHDSNLVACLI